MKLDAELLEARAALKPALRHILEKQRDSFADHATWRSATEQVMHSIAHADPENIATVIGPPGVGKTRLLRELTKQLKEELGAETQREIPVICMPLKANETGVFSWKDFYWRILRILNPAFSTELLTHETHLAIPGAKATVDTLRENFEKAIKYRQTKVLLLDEAQHIAMGRMAKSLMEQLDVLKSIATTVPLVLCGPYALWGSSELSGQLARRLTAIHFPRYTLDSLEEFLDFRDALGQLADDLKPWRFNFNWEDRETVEYFFHRSIGCIGILRPWLLRAVVRSARMGEQEVTRKHLDLTAKSAKTLNIILDEVEQGEILLRDSADDWKRLKRRLGGGRAESPEGADGTETDKSKGNGLRPGEAAPKRYPTDDQPPQENSAK